MEREYFNKHISNFIPKEILEIFPDYNKIIKDIKSQDYGNVLTFYLIHPYAFLSMVNYKFPKE